MKFEQYNFTSEFQDLILACLIRHSEKFFAFGEIIKPEYFTGSAAIETVFKLQDYRKKYGSMPEFKTLANYVFYKTVDSNPDRAAEVKDYVQNLAKISTKDCDSVLDVSINFARERAIFDAIKRIYTAQTEGDTKVNAVKLMEEAVAIGTNYNDLGRSLYHHSDDIIDLLSKTSYGISTGNTLLDKVWPYGWAPGWLVVLLAPPKRFKTAFAINLALSIVKNQDADVLYYACEISQELAAMRAYSSLTGWTMTDFIDNPEQGKVKLKEVMRTDMIGNIWAKGFASKSASISDIKAHAKQVIALYGVKPKAIVIDYAETVRPDKTDKTMPDWRQQADIYTQARAMGAELGCTVIMPDRCNREAVGRKVPSMASFQGSFEKAGIVDIAIGLCSTEAEYLNKRIRYFIFLNRHGEEKKHYEGTVDAERMKLTLDREIDYEPDEEDNVGRGRGGGRGGRGRDVANDANRDYVRGAELVMQDGAA